MIAITPDLEDSLTRDKLTQYAQEIMLKQSIGFDIAKFISEIIPGEKGDASVSKFAGREDLKKVF